MQSSRRSGSTYVTFPSRFGDASSVPGLARTAAFHVQWSD
jgi:hypothetical protein